MSAIISQFEVITPVQTSLQLILEEGKWLMCNDNVHKVREFLDMSQGIYFVTFYYGKFQMYVDTEME